MSENAFVSILKEFGKSPVITFVGALVFAAVGVFLFAAAWDRDPPLIAGVVMFGLGLVVAAMMVVRFIKEGRDGRALSKRAKEWLLTAADQEIDWLVYHFYVKGSRQWSTRTSMPLVGIYMAQSLARYGICVVGSYDSHDMNTLRGPTKVGDGEVMLTEDALVKLRTDPDVVKRLEPFIARALN